MSETLEQKYYECEVFWSDGMLEDVANQKRIATTLSMVPQYVKSLADIGCGNGVFLHELKRERPNMQVIGVERSHTALTFVQTEKEQGDILDIPLASKSYDCVACLQVLEHIPHDKYNLALSELARVSKKYLLISVPFREHLEENVSQCPCCKTTFNNDLHMRSYNDADIDNLFAEQGFECIRKELPITHYQYWGISWLKSLKSGLKRRQPTEFQSPLCPVCGYANENYITAATSIVKQEHGNQQDAIRPEIIRGKGFKDKLKSLWPKKEIPGYWIVALYAKPSL